MLHAEDVASLVAHPLGGSFRGIFDGIRIAGLQRLIARQSDNFALGLMHAEIRLVELQIGIRHSGCNVGVAPVQCGGSRHFGFPERHQFGIVDLMTAAVY
ncbi:hypothetical protein D3C72_2244110 [compost metagenome]